MYATETQVQQLPLQSQFSRDKCWLERKGCFTQKAGTLERQWTDVQRPSLRFWVKEWGLKGKFRVGDCIHIDEKGRET